MVRTATLLAILAAFAGGVSAPAAASGKAPIEGRWQKGNMEVLIGPCGDSLCGTVLKASERQQARAENGSGTELIGARLIKDIEQVGPDTYRARVFVADRNVHARGTIRQIGPRQINVKGCVLGVICKTQTWVKVSR